MSIDFERRGAIALVTINRPDAMNALDVEHDRALAEVWKVFEADTTLLVAILTGAGGRAFCSGGDLKTYMPWRRDVALRGTEGAISFGGMTQTGEITKPIIAAIQGHCIAGGLELALACDIRICTPDSQFGLAEVKWGVLPGGGGTQRLPRLVPMGHALEMILTGTSVDAYEAEWFGLVNRVVTEDTLFEAAFSIAERIAANGPHAVKAAKRAVLQGLELPLKEGLALEGELQGQLLRTSDVDEGLRAFRERRRPVYTHGARGVSSKRLKA